MIPCFPIYRWEFSPTILPSWSSVCLTRQDHIPLCRFHKFSLQTPKSEPRIFLLLSSWTNRNTCMQYSYSWSDFFRFANLFYSSTILELLLCPSVRYKSTILLGIIFKTSLFTLTLFFHLLTNISTIYLKFSHLLAVSLQSKMFPSVVTFFAFLANTNYFLLFPHSQVEPTIFRFPQWLLLCFLIKSAAI